MQCWSFSVLSVRVSVSCAVHYVFRSIVALHSFRLKQCSGKYVVQCSTVQYIVMQCNAMQSSEIECSVVQRRTFVRQGASHGSLSWLVTLRASTVTHSTYCPYVQAPVENSLCSAWCIALCSTLRRALWSFFCMLCKHYIVHFAVWSIECAQRIANSVKISVMQAV